MNFHCRLFNISKSLSYWKHSFQINISPRFSINKITSLQCNYLTTNTNLCRQNKENSFLKSVISKLPFVNISKDRLKVAGYFLYELVADNIEYSVFFNQFNLPDTFYSWFVVTELHVWMLLTRTMAEEDDGRVTRNSIVQALWSDVNTRVKQLGAANPSGVRMQVDELSQQFQAALIGYDEGLLSNDKVLASALWRRVFQQKCNNPEHLEQLVHYVRKQIKLLDDLSSEEFFEKRNIKWSAIQLIVR